VPSVELDQVYSILQSGLRGTAKGGPD
jgi:hypothetical protein